jgi:DNA polymerase-1
MDALVQDAILATEIAGLLRAAIDRSVQFRLSGADIVAGNAHLADPEVMAELRRCRDELWNYIGGATLDQPSLDLMATRFKHIRIVTPQREAEALDVIAQLEADADARSERFVKGVLGLDIETMANASEELRGYVHLKKDGTVVQPSPPARDPDRLQRKGNGASTAGLDPHRSSVRLAQLYGGGRTCLVMDTRLVPLQVLAPVLSRRRTVIHNAAFELRFLHHAGIAMPRFECSMQAAGLMLGVHRRSLEDTARYYFGIELPKELQLSDWGADRLSQGQIAYAALDAILAFQLWPHLLRDLIKAERIGAYVLQRQAIPPVVRMQARGALMARAAHEGQIQHWQAELAQVRGDYHALTGELPPETPADIRVLLKDKLPPEVLQAWPRTKKTGELSTATEHLLRHAVTVPELRLICTIKKFEKLLSSFGTTLAARISKDGRINAGFNIASAKTGRMSCSDPNLQQLPRDPAFRNCFVAADGYILVVADYNMMELRAAAEISNDALLRREFTNRVDLHRRTASQMFAIPEDQVNAEQRQAAKPINFGVIYGAGGAGLAQSAWASYGVVLTPQQAQAARDRFLARYRTLARWMRDHADLCQHRGHIAIGRYGRVILAEWENAPQPTAISGPYGYDDDDDDSDIDDEDGLDARIPYGRNYPPRAISPLKYTLCCNAPVQGAGAEIITRAIALIDRMLEKAGIPGGLVLVVHDELALEVPEDHAKEAAKLLRKAMEQAFREHFADAPIYGLVDVHIGKAWGEAKEEAAICVATVTVFGPGCREAGREMNDAGQ